MRAGSAQNQEKSTPPEGGRCGFKEAAAAGRARPSGRSGAGPAMCRRCRHVPPVPPVPGVIPGLVIPGVIIPGSVPGLVVPALLSPCPLSCRPPPRLGRAAAGAGPAPPQRQGTSGLRGRDLTALLGFLGYLFVVFFVVISSPPPPLLDNASSPSPWDQSVSGVCPGFLWEPLGTCRWALWAPCGLNSIEGFLLTPLRSVTRGWFGCVFVL